MCTTTQKRTGLDNSITFILEQKVEEQLSWMTNNYLDDGFALQLRDDKRSNGLLGGDTWIPIPPMHRSLVQMLYLFTNVTSGVFSLASVASNVCSLVLYYLSSVRLATRIFLL